MNTKKRFDFFLLATYFCCISVYMLWSRSGYVVGTILFFYLPALYLTIRRWKEYKHAILFSLVVGFAMGLYLEGVSAINSVWTWKPYFEHIKLGPVFLIAIPWYICWVWIVISVWKVFFDRRHHQRREGGVIRRHLLFLIPLISFIILLLYVLVVVPHVFALPYAYLIFGGIIFILPILFIVWRHKDLIPRLLKLATVLSIFFLIYEIIGVYLGQWRYDGLFIGVVNIFATKIPIEELVLWVFLGSMTIAVWYEEFENNLT